MKALALVSSVLAAPAICLAQNNVWHPINPVVQGVEASWRWRQELRDQFIAELKFENRNPYKVDVSFKSVFVCNNGREVVDGGNMVSVAPNGVTGGQWAGLLWYPCAGEHPRSGGFREMRVQKSR